MNPNMMKKIFYILIALFASCAFLGCSDDGESESARLSRKIVGEWHLVLWNAQTPTDFDAYCTFNADRTFEIYQRIETVRYQKYTGSYQIKNSVLSGVYDDATPWGSTYEISFDEEDEILTMISESSAGEISVYERTTIPDAIVNGPVLATKVSAGEEFRLL